VPPVKTPFTLRDYIPKVFFNSDSSDDDPVEGEVALHGFMVDKCEEASTNHVNTT